jgi:hypothetical protein
MLTFEGMGRSLAKTPRARFIGVYGFVAGVALGVAMFGANVHHDLLVRVGAVAATVLTGVLVTVTTWYRRETVVNAAILLALAWTLARLVGICFATVLVWRSLGAIGWAMLGALFGLPIAILEALLIGGVLVAVLRRIRPPLAAPIVTESDAGTP